MKVLLCTSNLPGALLIRALTWSRWSHAAIIDGDEVIEATWPRVRVTPLAEVLAKRSRWTIIDLPCRSSEAVIAAARSQVGKPYDLRAVLGIAIHRDWQDPSRWFCSELVAWAFEQAGSPLFRADAVQRVTPQHLWMLAPEPPPAEAATQINEGREMRPSAFSGGANG